MRIDNRTIHKLVFITGIVFTLYSVFSSVFLHNPHFYTFFALGTWFILDYIDYKINKTSILTYFLKPEHFDAFAIFFVAATISCFIVDFIFGVQISRMWIWREYKVFDYVIMYMFMNGAFVLGMYELYRLITTFYKRKLLLTPKHTLHFKMSEKNQYLLAQFAFIIGLFFILSPLYSIFFDTKLYIEYIMVLPFIGTILVTDSLTYALHGHSIMGEVLHGNINLIASLITTSLTASFITELINLPSHEWVYVKMPFMHLTILTIPIAVFVGWLPLVVSTVTIVNFVKRFDFVKDHRKSVHAMLDALEFK